MRNTLQRALATGVLGTCILHSPLTRAQETAPTAGPLSTQSAEGSSPATTPMAAAPQTSDLLQQLSQLTKDNRELRGRMDRLELSASPPPPGATSMMPGREGRTPVLLPSIVAEMDYRIYPSETEGNTGFALARLRPGLVLAPNSWFRAVTTIEFAEEHPTILDAYMKLRASDAVEFTVGYSKPPMFASFTYEQEHTTPFPDLTPVVRSFFIRRDLGADIHVAPRAIPIEAWLRVGNGSGSPLGNDNALPSGYGALDWVLGRAGRSEHAQDSDFGLRVGAGGLVERTGDHNGISGQTALGFVYFRPTIVSGVRVVGESHAVAYLGPVRATVEGAAAYEARSRDDDGNPATPRVDLPSMQSYGLSAEVAWVVHGIRREVGRAPSGHSREGARWDGGAVELAARYDGLWFGRGASDVKQGGSQGGALAVKWWPTAYLAATLAGYATHYNSEPIEEPTTAWSWGLVARASFFWGTVNPASRARESRRAAAPH